MKDSIIYLLEFGEDSHLTSTKDFVGRFCFGTRIAAEKAAKKYPKINRPKVIEYNLYSHEAINYTGDCPSCDAWMEDGYCPSCGADNS